MTCTAEGSIEAFLPRTSLALLGTSGQLILATCQLSSYIFPQFFNFAGSHVREAMIALAGLAKGADKAEKIHAFHSVHEKIPSALTMADEEDVLDKLTCLIACLAACTRRG